jgi:hypothetical protein
MLRIQGLLLNKAKGSFVQFSILVSVSACIPKDLICAAIAGSKPRFYSLLLAASHPVRMGFVEIAHIELLNSRGLLVELAYVVFFYPAVFLAGWSLERDHPDRNLLRLEFFLHVYFYWMVFS